MASILLKFSLFTVAVAILVVSWRLWSQDVEWFGEHAPPEQAIIDLEAESLHASSSPKSSLKSSSTGLVEKEAEPVEVFRSVYDLDEKRRFAALEELDRHASGMSLRPDSVLRWRGVVFDTGLIIGGDVRSESFVADEFQVTLFTDTVFNIEETGFSHIEIDDYYNWYGKLVGEPESRVEFLVSTFDGHNSVRGNIVSQSGHYFLTETRIPQVYFVAQLDPAYISERQSKPIDTVRPKK